MADSKGKPDIILIGTGSEVHLCLQAYEKLKKEGIKARVVSMPCWSLYELQGTEYWEEVLPTSVKARVSVEAGSTFGWRRYVGLHDNGGVIGVSTFGESAPIADLWPEFGFTVEHITAKAKEVLRRNGKKIPGKKK